MAYFGSFRVHKMQTKLVAILAVLTLVCLIQFIVSSKLKQLRFSCYNSIFRKDSISKLTDIKNNTFFRNTIHRSTFYMIWSESVSSAPASFGVELFLMIDKNTQLRSTVASCRSLTWQGFQYRISFFAEDRRVLKNTPSKHKHLGRSFCIVATLSWRCTGVVLALF